MTPVEISVTAPPGHRDLAFHAAARVASTLLVHGYLVMDQVPGGAEPGSDAWRRQVERWTGQAVQTGLPLAVVTVREAVP